MSHEVSKWLAHGLFHLLINGVFLGVFNPLILTSWDIQVVSMRTPEIQHFFIEKMVGENPSNRVCKVIYTCYHVGISWVYHPLLKGAPWVKQRFSGPSIPPTPPKSSRVNPNISPWCCWEGESQGQMHSLLII